MAVSRMPRIVGMISIVVGAIAVVVGITVYFVVRDQLVDQHIVVADDARFFAGSDVKGPLTAYAQARALNDHALDIGKGKTYAQLARDDPTRDTVMTADFLQASLYTSVVAFGLSALIAVLGVMFVLVGLALRALDERTVSRRAPPPGSPASVEP
jgi:hypothetical protein